MALNEKHGAGASEAAKMVALFASVGVTHFSITHTDVTGKKRGFRPGRSLQDTRRSMPYLIDSAARRQNNVIIRPHHPPAVFLIQLDDIQAGTLTKVRPAALLIVSTSPGKHQAWVAVKGVGIGDRKEFARRVRKGSGADPCASGATRVAGTANFKQAYSPDFPIVQIAAAQPGLTVTPSELEALGLVAAPEDPVMPVQARGANGGAKKWPSYRYCIDHASRAHDSDRPDISRVDFVWCMTAVDWGWSIEDTASRLMEESSKARENGPSYAINTTRNAADAVARRTRF